MTDTFAKNKPRSASTAPGDRRSGDDGHGSILLRVARSAIERRLGGKPSAAEEEISGEPDPSLYEPGASFVTLRSNSALRGCIGSVKATTPLLDDVRANAVAAAVRDPRFPPVSVEELPRIRIEVSVLSKPQPIRVDDEESLWAAVRPGIDGLSLRWRDHRATLLPQVWESLPTAVEFLSCLKHKAGLDSDFWAADIEIETYTVQAWEEGR